MFGLAERRVAPSRVGRRGLLGGALLGAVLLGAGGCSGEPSVLAEPGDIEEPALDPGQLFSMSHLVEVEIELAASDWETLRREGRDLVGVYTRSQFDYEYTYFEANVTIDGVRHERVGLRKKGYWGSLSVARPSFKIDLDRFDPEASHLGVDKLTLNNDFGDPTRTRECMAYQLFARAGLPASRCNLAHVVVNGQDLGTYSNVESIDKQMLARHFSDAEGNLYEGQQTDFVRPEVERIELKTNEKKNDRSDLMALVDALESDDAVLLERLGAVVDLDRFRDYWAMELLSGHWDGYANNSNNYMLYRNPETGLFHFLPWGTDNAFERANPRSMYARGRIASRLYALPAERQRIWDRFAELTETVWDAEALLAHIDQVAVNAPDAVPALLDQERQFVMARADRLRPAFGKAPPRARGRSNSPCVGTIGEISGVFSTTFAATTTPADRAGEFQAQLSLDGKAMLDVAWTGSAGFEPGSAYPIPGVRLVGTLPDARQLVLQLYVAPSTFSPGAQQFHGGETFGSVVVRSGKASTFVGNIGSGTLELAEASAVSDAPLSGRFSGQTYQFACAGL